MSSSVYFTDFRCRNKTSLPVKLEMLLKRSGLDDLDLEGKFVAIKIHFGEAGNLAFLRHQYAAVLVSHLKARGAKPFLTDCNTLYVGSRTNALDHLDTANLNGYLPQTVGAQIIIADGLKGSDEVAVSIPDNQYCKAPKIGRALRDADVIVSLTHFKGHEATGFGGCLKNLGMGGGSRAGKMEMHSEEKPQVIESRCICCRLCSKVCAHSAQSFDTGHCVIDYSKCVGCGRCLTACPKDAIVAGPDADNNILNFKIAEYTKAVLLDKQSFHIAIANAISPLCDCYGCNDAPITPDIGMFASSDPVALDKACVDAVNAQSFFENSALGEAEHRTHDHFTDLHPATNWKSALENAQKIGLGTEDYKLISLDL